MTVSELIEELAKYPADMHVVWRHSDHDGEWLSKPLVLMRQISFSGEKYDEADCATNFDTKDKFALLKVLTIEYDSYGV